MGIPVKAELMFLGSVIRTEVLGRVQWKATIHIHMLGYTENFEKKEDAKKWLSEKIGELL